MTRRALFLLVLLAVVAAGATTAYWFVLDGDVLEDRPRRDVPGEAVLDARIDLLTSPQQVDFFLTVDHLPRDDGGDTPRQEQISADGAVDFEARDAELLYNFEDVSNAAGFFGNFDTMNVIYDDGTGYLEVFTSGPPWVSVVPEDAANQHVLRLREVMLTTPLIIPGLLDVAASSDPVSDAGSTYEIPVAALAETDDDMVAGMGTALEEIGAQVVTLDADLPEESDAEIELSFTYLGRVGEAHVNATYEMSPVEEVQVEAPAPSQVRRFSSFFGN